MFGINSVFWPVMQRSLGLALLLVLIDLVIMIVVILPLAARRRGGMPLWLIVIILVGSLLFSGGIGALISLHTIYHFRAATRILATCPPQPAWVDTYATTAMRHDPDDGPTYVLNADITPRENARFPRRIIEIDRGFDSSNMPSPILKHVAGTVYMSARFNAPIVIEVEGQYLCSK